MPTAALNTFGNNACQAIYNGRDAKVQHVKFGVSLTLAKGTVVGQITATGLWKAYANGSADGSEVAKGVLQYDLTTDASGNHTLGGGNQAETQLSAPVYFSGCFRTTELTGLDAAGVTDLGKIISGTVADGILVVTGD
jgi:hypothetical protein